MQVRQLLVTSLLALGAAGAMSQEIDRSETLQARSLATRQGQAESSAVQARARVAAQTREAPAGGAIKAGERADGLAVDAAPKISWAKWHVTRPYGKAWLDGDRHSRNLVVAERR